MVIGKRCSVIGCDKVVVALGLCDTHYRRLRRRGDVNAGVPDRWGEKYKSPLNSVWKGVMRSHKHRCDPRWYDFFKFAQDVGEKPDVPVRFSRLRKNEPYGPCNWLWVEISRGDTEPKKKAREYQRQLRVVNPEYFLNQDLRKNYGVDIEWYREQFSKQGGVCAICGAPETATIRGKVLRLSVDHCHTTGAVRGLLCRRCNNGIGHLKHDVQILARAIEYLT